MSASPTNESSAELAAAEPVLRLEQALRRVLGSEDFEVALSDSLDGQPWYSSGMAPSEAFSHWVRDRVSRANDQTWVFDLVRATERRKLADQLGVPAEAIEGKGLASLAHSVLVAAGLPSVRLRSLRGRLTEFEELSELVSHGDDERAASLARQRVERLLRTIGYFFGSVGLYDAAFEEVLRDPDKLRLPRRLDGVTLTVDLATAICEDGWADLGFLALFVRKVATALERQRAALPRGGPLALMTAREHESFSALSMALQPYTHDRPSAAATRRPGLLTALDTTVETVRQMIRRNVVPEEMLVLERCNGVFGAAVGGRLGTGEETHVVMPSLPPLGGHVFILRSSPERYARCIWAPAPWSSEL